MRDEANSMLSGQRFSTFFANSLSTDSLCKFTFQIHLSDSLCSLVLQLGFAASYSILQPMTCISEAIVRVDERMRGEIAEVTAPETRFPQRHPQALEIGAEFHTDTPETNRHGW
jgi:hypothetical protein